MNYGDIYLVEFSTSIGHEYQGKRPALIIQSDMQLRAGNMVTIMPLTSQTSKAHKDDIMVRVDGENKLYSDSLIKVHHIESFDRSRFINKIGKINVQVMNRVRNYLKFHFNIE